MTVPILHSTNATAILQSIDWIRPHDLLPGEADEDELRPRPSPALFFGVDGGRRVKSGIVYGETDEFSYNIVENPVRIHDLNATILHLLGVDHERLTYRFQGRDFRLTDVHGDVVREILA